MMSETSPRLSLRNDCECWMFVLPLVLGFLTTRLRSPSRETMMTWWPWEGWNCALGVARKRLKVKGMKCLKKLFLKPLWHRGIVFLEYFLKEYLLRNFLRGGLRSNYSARGHLRGISRAVRVPSAVRVHATLFYHVLSTKLFWEYHSKGM